MAKGGLEHAYRAEDVHRRVLDGVLDGDTDVRLRREVEHRLGTELVEHVVERLADVADLEVSALGDVLALAFCERVDDDDLVAAGEEGVRHVGADEPGAPWMNAKQVRSNGVRRHELARGILMPFHS